MKLPPDTLVPREKLTQYLLVRLARGDKSGFLKQAGYTQGNPQRLEDDLRRQILPLEAVMDARNEFGEFYVIRGVLTGPNGISLHVHTVWIKESLSGRTKFVTLYPDRETSA